MNKTILLTGATDGIGLETAKMLAPLGHKLLLYMEENPEKLKGVENIISELGRMEEKLKATSAIYLI